MMFEEAGFRFAVFAGVFVLMALVEQLFPRRDRHPARAKRWITNWAIVALDGLALRLVFPLAAVGAALWAENQSFGLFYLTPLPAWLEGLIAYFILDFAIWAAHVASHKIPVLWRVHKVHHADVDLDVTSGFRFHPIEILLSMAWKMAVIVALGAPVLAVFLFEVMLNASAMFNHSNINIPERIDKIIRLFIVTPDMHRVHHSIEQRETDANYGFQLSIWDRLFATYIPEPALGQKGMIIGLEEHQSDDPTRFLWSLKLPFMKAQKSSQPSKGFNGKKRRKIS
jgi:sterol desaturase/sphingolipid hydroxylase (fatty acid hydroxylase superfamily)